MPPPPPPPPPLLALKLKGPVVEGRGLSVAWVCPKGKPVFVVGVEDCTKEKGFGSSDLVSLIG